MPKNPMDPLSKQWEQENCKLTLPAILVYGGALVARFTMAVGIPLMLLGVWQSKGWFRKALGIVMILVLFTDESTEGQLIKSLYFFGSLYVMYYLGGQDHKRKRDLRDWERE